MPVSAKYSTEGAYKEALSGWSSFKTQSVTSMTKSMIETISEAIRDTKHPFRKTDNRPRKAQKNRYERRKIKEYLHLADWEAEAI